MNMRNKKEKENQILSNKKIFTLIGMMGTGKSKIGRLVANNLAYKFYDVGLAYLEHKSESKR